MKKGRPLRVGTVCRVRPNICNLNGPFGRRRSSKRCPRICVQHELPPPRFCVRWRRVVERNNAKSISLSEKQHSKFGPAEARRVRQYGLEYWLQVFRRTRDDPQYLEHRCLLLQSLGEFPFQLSAWFAAAGNAPRCLRSGRTKTASMLSALRPLARQGHLVGTVTGPLPVGRSQGSILSTLAEPHDELAPLCMTGEEHCEG
jgi:hypothetical protein